MNKSVFSSFSMVEICRQNIYFPFSCGEIKKAECKRKGEENEQSDNCLYCNPKLYLVAFTYFKVFYLKNIDGWMTNLGNVKGSEKREEFAKPVHFTI